jgi:flagellar basal-body rod modification protein FlgD
MTSIYSGVNATSSVNSTTTDSKVGKGMGAMDATDFMKLLTTQLTAQDPTAPMDNSQMLAQMAQFTSLSNSTEMNSTLKAIATKLGAIDSTGQATTAV